MVEVSGYRSGDIQSERRGDRRQQGDHDCGVFRSGDISGAGIRRRWIDSRTVAGPERTGLLVLLDNGPDYGDSKIDSEDTMRTAWSRVSQLSALFGSVSAVALAVLTYS